jgi:hypothetical protein
MFARFAFISLLLSFALQWYEYLCGYETTQHSKVLFYHSQPTFSIVYFLLSGCGSLKFFNVSFQLKLYQLVIEDVVTNVRDAFLDEGVDEQVLQEMKQIWTNRLMASKAVEATPEPTAPQSQPAILANNPKVS